MKNKKISIEVSLFSEVRNKRSRKTVDLIDWFFYRKIKDEVEYVRENLLQHPEEYKKHKPTMPAITPSGQFTRRGKKWLIRHSGYICVDIDSKDNLHITDFATLRDEIAKIENVLFCALSLSKQGVFCFMPIKYPEKHAEHYRMVIEDFEKLGITIDKSCSDVSRLRIASYDINAHINYDAVPYERLKEPERKSKNTSNATSHKKDNPKRSNPAKPQTQYTNGNKHRTIKSVITKINEKKIDMTSTYKDWFSIGCALANEFGEEGREYFHEISKFHCGYDEDKTDQLFDQCSKYDSYTMGTIIYLANNAGIR